MPVSRAVCTRVRISSSSRDRIRMSPSMMFDATRSVPGKVRVFIPLSYPLGGSADCSSVKGLPTRRFPARCLLRSECGRRDGMPRDHLDVLVVGAGISGIGAGCHLVRECPDRTFAILESRDALGGTWDLFRYPGIRSDSDMFTFVYEFEPWRDPATIAEGGAIRDYLASTARKYGVDERIWYRHRVVRAGWRSEDARWTVMAERTDTGELLEFTCSFLFV